MTVTTHLFFHFLRVRFHRGSLLVESTNFNSVVRVRVLADAQNNYDTAAKEDIANDAQHSDLQAYLLTLGIMIGTVYLGGAFVIQVLTKQKPALDRLVSPQSDQIVIAVEKEHAQNTKGYHLKDLLRK